MYSSSLPESYIFYPAFFSILSLALTVRVREGVTAFATGESMASWVRTTGLYVIQEGDGKMLVSTAPGGAATGWIRTEDLVKA